MANSDHTDFSESTEEIAPLTEDEKKAKLEELRERLKAKRAAQSELDKETARQNEVGCHRRTCVYLELSCANVFIRKFAKSLQRKPKRQRKSLHEKNRSRKLPANAKRSWMTSRPRSESRPRSKQTKLSESARQKKPRPPAKDALQRLLLPVLLLLPPRQLPSPRRITTRPD